MLTKFNFYDGVPVGPDNFSEFFNTVQSNVDAVLTLAFDSNGATDLSDTGGHLQTNPVEYRLLDTSQGSYWVLSSGKARTRNVVDANGNSVAVFSPELSKGILFAKTGRR